MDSRHLERNEITVNEPIPSTESELDLLWVALGRLALNGHIPLPVVRWACAVLVILSSYRRKGKVKTYVATELGTSRRVVREIVECWNEPPRRIHELVDVLSRRMEAKFKRSDSCKRSGGPTGAQV